MFDCERKARNEMLTTGEQALAGEPAAGSPEGDMSGGEGDQTRN